MNSDPSEASEFEKEADYENTGRQLNGDSDFSGPISKRKCTNVYFLIIFLFLNAGLIGTATYILINGNPNSLTQGNDLWTRLIK